MIGEEIKTMVNEILRETDLGTTPVAIVSIATFYGFNVYKANMSDNVAGLILADEHNIKNFDSNKIIIVNSNQAPTRQRFTIAHELGHYFLDGKPPRCYAHRDSGVYNAKERAANSFASALLMPEDDVKIKIDELKDINPSAKDYYLIREVANTFNVSTSAAKVRLEKLGVI